MKLQNRGLVAFYDILRGNWDWEGLYCYKPGARHGWSESIRVWRFQISDRSFQSVSWSLLSQWNGR